MSKGKKNKTNVQPNLDDNGKQVANPNQYAASDFLMTLPTGHTISSRRYFELEQENKDLKNQIKQFTKLEEENNTYKKTIEELEEENKRLKEQLNLLEKKYNKLEVQYNEIKVQYNEIKVQYNEIKEENKQLKEKMDEREMYRLLNKFEIAIQDLNSLENLEINIKDKQIIKELKELHQERNLDCHYLNETKYSKQELDERRTILLEKINNMPDEVKNEFNLLYPNILSGIHKYIAPNRATPQQKTLLLTKRWWNS